MRNNYPTAYRLGNALPSRANNSSFDEYSKQSLVATLVAKLAGILHYIVAPKTNTC